MTSLAELYHVILLELSQSYRKLAAVKAEGWKAAGPYVPRPQQRGTAEDYCRHYTAVLQPLLPPRRVTPPQTFLDLGAAPGGLTIFLSRDHGWKGTAITLGEPEGGIPMSKDYDPAQVTVRFADVTKVDEFMKVGVIPREKEGESGTPFSPTYDLINLGIVIDAVVGRFVERTSFSATFLTQLTLASTMLAPGGTLMLVLGLTFATTDCVIVTLVRLASIAAGGVYVIPTLYTKSSARKQFYVVVNDVLEGRLDDAFVTDMRSVWRSDSTKKRITVEQAAAEDGRARQVCAEMLRKVHGFEAFCGILREALERGPS